MLDKCSLSRLAEPAPRVKTITKANLNDYHPEKGSIDLREIIENFLDSTSSTWPEGAKEASSSNTHGKSRKRSGILRISPRSTLLNGFANKAFENTEEEAENASESSV